MLSLENCDVQFHKWCDVTWNLNVIYMEIFDTLKWCIILRRCFIDINVIIYKCDLHSMHLSEMWNLDLYLGPSTHVDKTVVIQYPKPTSSRYTRWKLMYEFLVFSVLNLIVRIKCTLSIFDSMLCWIPRWSWTSE